MFVKEYFSKCIVVLSIFLIYGFQNVLNTLSLYVFKPLEFIKISFTKYHSSISVTTETIRIFWKFYYPETCVTCPHSFIPIVTISEVALSKSSFSGLHSSFFLELQLLPSTLLTFIIHPISSILHNFSYHIQW